MALTITLVILALFLYGVHLACKWQKNALFELRNDIIEWNCPECHKHNSRLSGTCIDNGGMLCTHCGHLIPSSPEKPPKQEK